MTIQNKTKIIATIGPASSSKEKLKIMINEGVSVYRINFSHGTHKEHAEVISHIGQLNKELKRHTAILADLQGPKLRIGEVGKGTVLLAGRQIIITTKPCIGTAKKVSITYPEFAKDVKAGNPIMIDDGKILLEAVHTNRKDEVKAKVIQGGKLSSRKGVNLPNTKISQPSLTEKDLEDLAFALKHKVSWIALSFVRSAKDITALKKAIGRRKKWIKIIAKIEKPEAIADLDRIIKEADALMVARGDLGVEVPMQDVPLLQKKIVEKCRKEAKPVIIATQMMETMMESMTPTRAEVNDVANAVMDGADAVMLSGETSVGKYPVEVIKAMTSIITKAETYKGIYYKEYPPQKGKRLITDSVCYAACRMSQRVEAKAIVTNSFSGYTGFKISSCRPKASVFVFTSNYKILDMLSLIWGVHGFYYHQFVSTDHTIADILVILKKEGYLQEGDLVINIASMPISDKGMSNMLKISKV